MRYTRETHIHAPPEAVWAFHEAPGALAKLTPPGQHIQILSGGDSLKPGSRVSLRMWLGPFPTTWIAEHRDYQPPHLFSDIQIQGPFKYWHHRHHFLPHPDGGTLLRDEIDFEPPLGRIGQRLLGRFLLRTLHQTFAYRHDLTKRLVESLNPRHAQT